MPRAKFGNKLDSPIKIKKISSSILLPEEKLKKINDKITSENLLHYTKETFEKLEILLDHYKINNDRADKWFFLALELAKEHIKGFWIVSDKLKRKPKRWDAYRSALLYIDVERKRIQSPDKSYKSICNGLKKNSEIWKGENSLLQRYAESKKEDAGCETSFVVRHCLIPHRDRVFDQDLYLGLIKLISSKQIQKN